VSLPLPDFAREARERSVLAPLIFRSGLVVTAGLGIVTAFLMWSNRDIASATSRQRNELDRARTEDDAAKALLRARAADLIATASVESSPRAILGDLIAVLPGGVSLRSLKAQYEADGRALVEMRVRARASADYDEFLDALSRSTAFADIRPGSESRQGPLEASLTAVHRRPQTRSASAAPPRR
jgi:hypothetical protein